MDKFERVINAFENRKPDRVPVFPILGDHAGTLQGLGIDQMYKDPVVAADAHLKAFKYYDYDVLSIQVEPSWPMVDDCGGEVRYSADKYPWVEKEPIQVPEDLQDLKTPDFKTAPKSSVLVEGTRLLAEKADAPVAAFVAGPLTFSLQIFPYMEFMMLCKTDKGFVKRLIKKSVGIINSYSKALKDAGANLLIVSEHDIQMFSPQFARENVLPYLSEVFTYDYNMLHMCGKVEKHLADNESEFKKLNALNLLSISHDVNLRKMQKLFKGYFGIAGNVRIPRKMTSQSTPCWPPSTHHDGRSVHAKVAT